MSTESLRFKSTNQTWTLKAEDAAYTGNPNSGQFSIYNGATKLWGITESGFTSEKNKPMFMAYGVTNFAVPSYLIFPNTSINIGNYYSTSTGRFTAPISANYIFTMSSISNNTAGVYRFFFHVNGSQHISDLHMRLDSTGAPGTYEYGERSWIVPMTVGDYFQIFFSAGPANIYPNSASSTHYHSLLGYMIN